LIKWLHHLLNPHCPDCKEEREDSKVCESCETLKAQLALSNHEKERLLNRLLEKPNENQVTSTPDVKPLLPSSGIPWRVRRQALESEDREKAKLLKTKESVEDLEKELGIAEEARESAGKS